MLSGEGVSQALTRYHIIWMRVKSMPSRHAERGGVKVMLHLVLLWL